MNDDLNNHIICIHDEYYLSIEFLLNHGISRQTIDNGTSRNRKELSRRWKHIKDNTDSRRNFIEYKSIPNKSREKLPKLSEIELSYKTAQDNQPELNLEKELRIVYFSLENAIKMKWTKFAPIYKEYFDDYDKIKKYAQTHIAFLELLEYKKNYKVKDLFPIYQKFEDLKFQTKNEGSFYRKLNQASTTNIENILIHNLFGRDSNNKIVCKKHIAFILDRYRKQETLTSSLIYPEFVRFCADNNLPVLSESKVRQILAEVRNKNKCLPFRQGIKAAEQKIIPYLVRKQLEYPGDNWQIDGTKIQIPYKDQNRKPKFLYVVVVLDGHSKLVLGYSIGKRENSRLIIEALKKAYKFTNYLPFEILHDNYSAFNSAEFIELKQKMEMIGTNFRKARIGNAKDKAHVERFFSTFQTTIQRKYTGYIGEGIKTKRKDGRTGPELMNSSLYKNSLKSIFEFDVFFEKLIDEYNTNKIGKKPSPKTLYDYTEPENVFKLENKVQFADMFYLRRKETLERSTIRLHSKKFSYQLDLDLEEHKTVALDYNTCQVNVAFDPSDIDEIFLFDIISGKYITSIKYTEPIGMIKKLLNQEDQDKYNKFYDKNKAFLKELADEAVHDRELINDEMNEDDSVDLMINMYSSKESINKAEEKIDLDELTSNIDHNEKEKKKRRKEDLGSYYEEGSLKIISKKYG